MAPWRKLDTTSNEKNKMKITITGATGFIGKYLVEELLAQGNQLTLLGRDFERLRSNFGESEQNGISLVQTEYDNDLPRILEGAEAIVHLSGLRWLKDKVLQDYITNNVTPTEHLYSAAAKNGIKNVIFLSTIAVYNPRINPSPLLEDIDCYPPTHYGLSKLLCEKIGNYYTSEFGLKIKNLRVGQVIGLGERQGFMLAEFIRRAAAKEALAVFGDGTGARDYIYVFDVVSAILLALRHPESSGVYNISLGKPVTHLQLAETVNRAFDNPGNLDTFPDKPQDKSKQWMSCERAWKELGWQPRWDLDEMFADMAGKFVLQSN